MAGRLRQPTVLRTPLLGIVQRLQAVGEHAHAHHGAAQGRAGGGRLSWRRCTAAGWMAARGARREGGRMRLATAAARGWLVRQQAKAIMPK